MARIIIDLDILAPGVQSVAELEVGDTFEVQILLEADANEQYDGAEFHIGYDPSVLSATSVVSEASAELPIALIPASFDNTSGEIDFSRGTFSAAPSGDLVLATFTFEVVGEGSTDLAFSDSFPFSDVTFGGVSILDGTDGASVSVGGENTPPVASDDTASTSEDTAVTVSVLDNDGDADGDAVVVTGASDPANGSVEVNSDGTITYTPDAEFNGTDSFTYDVSDGNGGTDTAKVEVTVNAVDDAPVASDDTGFSTPFNTALTINAADLLVNDDDGDPELTQALGVTGVGSASGGTVGLDNGVITFTPTPSSTGAASFEYTMTDGSGQSATATVSVSVGANTPPVASDDTASTSEDTAVTVSVLDNDGDADGDAVVVTGASDPANGSVEVNSDGTITYTPDAEFNGTDSFTYDVSDGNGGTDTATVEVTVNGTARMVLDTDTSAAGVQSVADLAVGDGFEVLVLLETGAGQQYDAAEFHLDFDPSVLAATGITVLSGAELPLELVPDAFDNTAGTVDFVRGTVSNFPSGSLALATISFDVVGAGSTDLAFSDAFPRETGVTFAGSSILEGTEGATVNATAQNTPPVASDDTASTSEDTAVTVSVLDNDGDADGDAVVVTKIAGVDAIVDAAILLSSGATATLRSDGTISYDPNGAFDGLNAGQTGADSFSYVIADAQGAEASAQVDVSINGKDETPGGDGIGLWLFEDGSPGKDETAQDNTALFRNGAFVSGGAAQFDGANDYVEIPDLPLYDLEEGSIAITLTVADLNGLSGLFSRDSSGYDGGGHVSAWVDSGGAVLVRHQTTSTSYTVETAAGVVSEGEQISLVYRFSDAGGMELLQDDGLGNLTLLAQNASADVSLAGNDEPWVVGAAQSRSGDGVADRIEDFLEGSIDRFEIYTGAPPSVDPNLPPTAAPDSATTQEDTALTNIAVLGNDGDADGDLPLVLAGVVQPANGTVTQNADGTLNYTPDADFFGTDVVLYTVRDARGATSQGVLTIEVSPVDDPAIANDDSGATLVNTPVAISVLANDVDVDGPAPSIASFDATSANGGTITSAGGVLTYTPAAGFEGADSFGYTLAGGDSAVVTVNVSDVPQPEPGIGLWLFEDGSPGKDETVQDNTALFRNGAFVSGGAAQFDGANDYVEIPDLPLYDLEEGSIAITLTVADLNGLSGLFSRDSSGYDGGGHVSAWVDSGGAVLVRHQTTSTSYTVETAAGVVSEGEQISLVYRFSDAGGMELLQDDGLGNLTLLAQNAGADVSLAGNDEPWVVGAAQSRSGDGIADRIEDFLEGSIDRFEIYTGAPPSVDPNLPPTAAPDSATTQEDTALTNIAVLGNDGDADGDLPLVLAGVVQPANGTVTQNADGTLNYTPDADFFGTDVVLYTVRDARGATSQGVLTIEVSPVDDPAIANDDSGATLVNTPVAISVLANDVDVDGPAPSIASFDATSANGGTITSAGGVLTYTPAAGFEGADSFGYTLAGGDSAVVTVNVSDVPQPEPGIGLWLFEDGSPGKDETVQDNTALFRNGAFVSGGAAQFDGANDYVEIPDLPLYDLEEGSIAITLTVADLNGLSGLFSRDSSGYDGGGHVSAWVDSGGAVLVRHQTTSTSYTVETAAGVVSEGEQISLVYRFSDAGGMELLQDDGLGNLTLLAQNAGADVSLAGNDEPWVVGAAQSRSGDGVADRIEDFLEGSIDRFEIYTGADDFIFV